MLTRTEHAVSYRPSPVREVFKRPESEIMERLLKLSSFQTICAYELGCYLYRVQEEGLWRKPQYCRRGKEYQNYGAWIAAELAFTPRKGRYLVQIARRIDAFDLSAEIISYLMTLGWAKTYQLLRSRSREEFMTWCKSTRQLSEQALKDYVREALAGEDTELGTLAESIPLRVLFSDSCNYRMFTLTRELFQKKYGVERAEDFMGCVCAHYLATSLPGHGEEIPLQLDAVLSMLEKQYGVRLQIVDV